MKKSKKKWFIIGGIATVVVAGVTALAIGFVKSCKNMFVPDEEFWDFDLDI